MSLNSLASSSLVPSQVIAAQDRSEDTVRARDVQNAASALVEYLPSETVALYLATIAALPGLSTVFPAISAAHVYWSFAALTPVLFALILMGKRRAAGQRRWTGSRNWPWWKTVSTIIAFLAWALVIPDAPYLSGDDNSRAIASLLAISVSILLGVIGRVFAPVPSASG